MRVAWRRAYCGAGYLIDLLPELRKECKARPCIDQISLTSGVFDPPAVWRRDSSADSGNQWQLR